jgi:hypothetical protein
MRKRIGLLWIVGFFGLLAAAVAQTPSPSTAGGPFDGTYRFAATPIQSLTYLNTTQLNGTALAQDIAWDGCPTR